LRQQLKRLENCAHRGDSSLAMKSILVTTIATVVLVGCGESSIRIEDAIRSADLETVQKEIEAGADINKIADSGMTPLHWATQVNDFEIVEYLVSQSANVNSTNSNGQTPLDMLGGFAGRFNQGAAEIKKLLKSNGATNGNSKITRNNYFVTTNALIVNSIQGASGQVVVSDTLGLQAAVEAGNVQAVKHFMNLRLDVNTRMLNLPVGDTVLHEAVFRGHKEVVELLISNGANINSESSGRLAENRMEPASINSNEALLTPLDYAIKYNRSEIADILRKHGGKAKAGLKTKFAGFKDSVRFKTELEATMRDNHGKPEDTLAAIDKLIYEKKPTGVALQEAMFYKGSILFQTDKTKAKEMLLKAKELAPKSETGKRIDGILKRFFKDEVKN